MATLDTRLSTTSEADADVILLQGIASRAYESCARGAGIPASDVSASAELMGRLTRLSPDSAGPARLVFLDVCCGANSHSGLLALFAVAIRSPADQAAVLLRRRLVTAFHDLACAAAAATATAYHARPDGRPAGAARLLDVTERTASALVRAGALSCYCALLQAATGAMRDVREQEAATAAAGGGPGRRAGALASALALLGEAVLLLAALGHAVRAAPPGRLAGAERALHTSPFLEHLAALAQQLSHFSEARQQLAAQGLALGRALEALHARAAASHLQPENRPWWREHRLLLRSKDADLHPCLDYVLCSHVVLLCTALDGQRLSYGLPPLLGEDAPLPCPAAATAAAAWEWSPSHAAAASSLPLFRPDGKPSRHATPWGAAPRSGHGAASPRSQSPRPREGSAAQAHPPGSPAGPESGGHAGPQPAPPEVLSGRLALAALAVWTNHAVVIPMGPWDILSLMGGLGAELLKGDTALDEGAGGGAGSGPAAEAAGPPDTPPTGPATATAAGAASSSSSSSSAAAASSSSSFPASSSGGDDADIVAPAGGGGGGGGAPAGSELSWWRSRRRTLDTALACMSSLGIYGRENADSLHCLEQRRSRTSKMRIRAAQIRRLVTAASASAGPSRRRPRGGGGGGGLDPDLVRQMIDMEADLQLDEANIESMAAKINFCVARTGELLAVVARALSNFAPPFAAAATHALCMRLCRAALASWAARGGGVPLAAAGGPSCLPAPAPPQVAPAVLPPAEAQLVAAASLRCSRTLLREAFWRLRALCTLSGPSSRVSAGPPPPQAVPAEASEPLPPPGAPGPSPPPPTITATPPRPPSPDAPEPPPPRPQCAPGPPPMDATHSPSPEAETAEGSLEPCRTTLPAGQKHLAGQPQLPRPPQPPPQQEQQSDQQEPQEQVPPHPQHPQQPPGTPRDPSQLRGELRVPPSLTSSLEEWWAALLQAAELAVAVAVASRAGGDGFAVAEDVAEDAGAVAANRRDASTGRGGRRASATAAAGEAAGEAAAAAATGQLVEWVGTCLIEGVAGGPPVALPGGGDPAAVTGRGSGGDASGGAGSTSGRAPAPAAAPAATGAGDGPSGADPAVAATADAEMAAFAVIYGTAPRSPTPDVGAALSAGWLPAMRRMLLAAAAAAAAGEPRRPPGCGSSPAGADAAPESAHATAAAATSAIAAAAAVCPGPGLVPSASGRASAPPAEPVWRWLPLAQRWPSPEGRLVHELCVWGWVWGQMMAYAEEPGQVRGLVEAAREMLNTASRRCREAAATAAVDAAPAAAAAAAAQAGRRGGVGGISGRWEVQYLEAAVAVGMRLMGNTAVGWLGMEALERGGDGGDGGDDGAQGGAGPSGKPNFEALQQHPSSPPPPSPPPQRRQQQQQQPEQEEQEQQRWDGQQQQLQRQQASELQSPRQHKERQRRQAGPSSAAAPPQEPRASADARTSQETHVDAGSPTPASDGKDCPGGTGAGGGGSGPKDAAAGSSGCSGCGASAQPLAAPPSDGIRPGRPPTPAKRHAPRLQLCDSLLYVMERLIPAFVQAVSVLPYDEDDGEAAGPYSGRGSPLAAPAARGGAGRRAGDAQAYGSVTGSTGDDQGSAAAAAADTAAMEAEAEAAASSCWRQGELFFTAATVAIDWLDALFPRAAEGDSSEDVAAFDAAAAAIARVTVHGGPSPAAAAVAANIAAAAAAAFAAAAAAGDTAEAARQRRSAAFMAAFAHLPVELDWVDVPRAAHVQQLPPALVQLAGDLRRMLVRESGLLGLMGLVARRLVSLQARWARSPERRRREEEEERERPGSRAAAGRERQPHADAGAGAAATAVTAPLPLTAVGGRGSDRATEQQGREAAVGGEPTAGRAGALGAQSGDARPTAAAEAPALPLWVIQALLCTASGLASLVVKFPAETRQAFGAGPAAHVVSCTAPSGSRQAGGRDAGSDGGGAGFDAGGERSLPCEHLEWPAEPAAAPPTLEYSTFAVLLGPEGWLPHSELLGVLRLLLEEGRRPSGEEVEALYKWEGPVRVGDLARRAEDRSECLGV